MEFPYPLGGTVGWQLGYRKKHTTIGTQLYNCELAENESAEVLNA